VIDIGTVCLKTSNGTMLILKNVRHAPDIRLHLISASVLDDDGYFNTFGGAQWKLTKGSLVVAPWYEIFFWFVLVESFYFI